MNKLDIEYDTYSDVLTIDGVKYRGEIFRTLGIAPLGTWIRINERNKYGTITLQHVSHELGKRFDEAAGLLPP